MLYHLAWCEAKLGETAAARAALQKALDSKTTFMERDAAPKAAGQSPAEGNSQVSVSCQLGEPLPTGGEAPIASEAGMEVSCAYPPSR